MISKKNARYREREQNEDRKGSDAGLRRSKPQEPTTGRLTGDVG